MEEIECGQDVTVLVGKPVSGKPVTLTSQPQHDGSERGGAEENGIGVDEEDSVLKVGGVVIVWSWQGHTKCVNNQGPTDNKGATQSDCVLLRDLLETLLVSVKVDGSNANGSVLWRPTYMLPVDSCFTFLSRQRTADCLRGTEW
jgi:hypothetical protein